MDKLLDFTIKDGVDTFHSMIDGGSTMKDIQVLRIDLAKNVFQLHVTNAKGKCVIRKRLSREKLAEFVAQISPCTIGIEACMSAHYWARDFSKSGTYCKNDVTTIC
jgi:hypothetical protein